MTDVRTFRAPTMQEALDRVSQELGNDAVVLQTRQISKKRLLPWQKPIEEVEITASRTMATRTASVRTGKKSAAATATAPRLSASSIPARTNHKKLDIVSEPSEPVADLLRDSFEPDSGRESSTLPFFKRRTPPARPSEPSRPSVRINRFTGRPIDGRSAARDGDPTAALAERLDAIQRMLRELGQNRAAQAVKDVPSDLFHLYTGLVDADVAEDVARDLVFRLKRNASPKQLGDPATAKSLLTAMVEAEIRCCEPIAPRAGRRKVVALVGATGVGKTTTIAKLAANFRLRSGVKMGLVTVDSYRVAAVEQLRTYAEIIDLPMKVVTSPVEMRRALDELAGLDLVLIDTAGRSPKDDVQIEELRSLLAEAHVDEVHLVLSLASSLGSIETAAAKFAAVGTSALILTKLDEAAGMGTLLSVARKVPLPISYLTAGQDVPDDIEPAHPARIARLVLGQERVAA